jgi:hypothetical protein
MAKLPPFSHPNVMLNSNVILDSSKDYQWSCGFSLFVK